MHRLILILFSLVCTSAAESPIDKYYPLRLFGTNLYDFTPVIAFDSKAKPIPGADRYFISGGVAVNEGARTKIITGFRKRYKFVGGDPYDASDMLGLMVASKMAEDGGGYINLGQYLGMSYTTKQYFRPVEVAEGVIIFNCPDYVLEDGTFTGFALPMKSARPTEFPLFDFGQPYLGDPSEFPFVFKVTTAGIKKENQLSRNEVQSKTGTATARLVEFQKRRAAEGSERAQYELGMRYYNGDGVEKDLDKATHWLKKSADGGNAKAQLFLKSLSKAQ